MVIFLASKIFLSYPEVTSLWKDLFCIVFCTFQANALRDKQFGINLLILRIDVEF